MRKIKVLIINYFRNRELRELKRKIKQVSMIFAELHGRYDFIGDTAIDGIISLEQASNRMREIEDLIRLEGG